MNQSQHEPLRAAIAMVVVALVIALAVLRILAENKPENLSPARLGPVGIVLHHSATKGNATEAYIDYLHAKRGWSVQADGKTYHIGYNYVVLQNGTVQTGRPLTVPGAHAGVTYYNERYIGICLIGDFDAGSNPKGKHGALTPTHAQEMAAARLAAGLCRKYDFGPETIIPHRTIRETRCPGSRVSIAHFRNEVRQELSRHNREVARR